MRLGCSGCLGSILLIATLIAGIVGTGWMVLRALQDPDLPTVTITAEDDARAQHKLYDLVRRENAGADKPEREPVVLTEAEVNAFLSRHLATTAELPLEEIRARLPGRGLVELAGRVPLGSLLGEWPLSGLGTVLPSRWLAHRVWLQLRAQVRIEPGFPDGRRRYVRLDVDRFAVGQQRLPVVLLRLVLDPAALRLLRWRLAGSVDAISVEPGRVIIRTPSPR